MKRTLTIPALSAFCALALGSASLQAQGPHAPSMHPSDHSIHGSSPLIDKVRRATARYRDINVALGEGWMQATPCVSGPNSGAMGVHFVLQSRVEDAELNANEPEALIYEPTPNGAWRLVGVEYIVIAEAWDGAHTDGTPAAVDGHLANLVGEPNRYRLPAFYELHVWAWRDNPVGSFADWNPRVSCERQPTP